MPSYTAPLRDTKLLLDNVLQLERVANLSCFESASPYMIEAMLGEGGRFVAEVLFPLKQTGDREGCTRHPDGSVTTPSGFKEAYKQFVESGWATLSMPPEFGGQGLPHVISSAFGDFLLSSNKFGSAPGRERGCQYV